MSRLHLAVSAALILFGAAPVIASDRPNILVFLADDLGISDLGYADPQGLHETPALDRLASEGVRFTEGYSANPVCSPSRAGLLTGRWPTRFQLTDWLGATRRERFAPAPLTKALPETETTLAESLAEVGYATAFVGKWHLGGQPENWPEHHGFEVNVAGHNRGTPPSYTSPYSNPRLEDGPPGEYLEDRLATESIRLLDRFVGEGRPFLLCHWFYAPHTPIHPPADLLAKFEAKAASMGLEDAWGEETQYHVSAKGPRRVREVRNRGDYAALVAAMDAAAGRVLDRLETLGVAENTIVVFLSDNGGLSTAEGHSTSNLPFRTGKGWLYEGGIRVPFLVRWPGVTEAGSTNSTPVTAVDLMPTLLAAAGVEPPPGLDGIDLAPVIKGAELPERDLFWHYPHYSNQGGFPGAVLRSGDWKLLENFEDGSVQLFDLATDPGEHRDLAADPSQAERVADLRARLHAWYAATDARFLEPLPDGPAPWRP